MKILLVTLALLSCGGSSPIPQQDTPSIPSEPSQVWERVCGSNRQPPNTSRLKTPLGWVVRISSGSHARLVYVPDPQHDWDVRR